MTTPARAVIYELQHLAEWGGRGYAVFNPHSRPVEDLPFIYGFNNCNRPNFMDGVLIAEDGTWLGGHTCSSESYMLHDLGVSEGARPDRHEGFRKHYPDGYRMDFVSYDAVPLHAGIQTAFERADEREKANGTPSEPANCLQTEPNDNPGGTAK